MFATGLVLLFLLALILGTAPVAGDKPIPAGRKMDNGYQILVTFSLDTDISLWAKTVKPPGWDAGDMIDTTTQHNELIRSMAFRALATVTEGSVEWSFNPEYIDQIKAIVGKNQTVTFHMPTGAKIACFGGLRTFETPAMVDGEHPTATSAIGITNTDPDSGAIEGPVYTPPA